MKRQGLRVALAESCTGGLVAAAITSVPGSSEVFDRGFVTYSNAAKQDCLAVSATLLKRHGAVSEETARAMAKGALANSVADIAVSVTGIAGPGGGSPDKPVGTVCFGAVRKGQRPISLRVAYGDIGRQAVRRQSVRQALALLEGLLSGENRQRPRLKG